MISEDAEKAQKWRVRLEGHPGMPSPVDSMDTFQEVVEELALHLRDTSVSMERLAEGLKDLALYTKDLALRVEVLEQQGGKV